MDEMNQYWADYWKEEFDLAYEMMIDMLYKVKGYSYSNETGSGGMDFNMQVKLIEIKADIKRDKKIGILQKNYKHYALLIFEVIRIKFVKC